MLSFLSQNRISSWMEWKTNPTSNNAQHHSLWLIDTYIWKHISNRIAFDKELWNETPSSDVRCCFISKCDWFLFSLWIFFNIEIQTCENKLEEFSNICGEKIALNSFTIKWIKLRSSGLFLLVTHKIICQRKFKRNLFLKRGNKLFFWCPPMRF